MRKLFKYAAVAVGARGWTQDRPVTGPLFAQLSISDPCDHRCVMCEYHPPDEPVAPISQFGGLQPGLMSMETFETLVSELEDMGTYQVDLVGRGEPLLNPDVINMVRHATGRGFRVTITSNGSRLDDDRARELVDGGLDLYQVSVDAASGPVYTKVHVSETPESFEALKARITNLGAVRARAASATPQIVTSFTISALNYFELVSMVETVHELGADGGHFQHCLPVTPVAEDIGLSDAQYEELIERLVPAALKRAAELGVETNLNGFAESPPTDRLDRRDTGPGTVPCYVGSYFTAILGNGNVMPCCQTEKVLGNVADDGFKKVWEGDRYAEFRLAARKLPEPSPALDTCQCDRCYFRPHNVAIHNMLHPLARFSRPEQRFSIRHLLRMTRMDQ